MGKPFENKWNIAEIDQHCATHEDHHETMMGTKQNTNDLNVRETARLSHTRT